MLFMANAILSVPQRSLMSIFTLNLPARFSGLSPVRFNLLGLQFLTKANLTIEFHRLVGDNLAEY